MEDDPVAHAPGQAFPPGMAILSSPGNGAWKRVSSAARRREAPRSMAAEGIKSGCPLGAFRFLPMRGTRRSHYMPFRLRRVPPREAPAHHGRARYAGWAPSGDVRLRGDPDAPRTALQRPIYVQHVGRSVFAPLVVPRPAASVDGRNADTGPHADPIRPQCRPDVSEGGREAVQCRMARHGASRLDGRRSAPAVG